jgi:hypothetical protein
MARLGPVARGALVGFSIGGVLAFILMWRGNWGEGEAMELSMIAAYIIAQPLAIILLQLFDWGPYAKHWVPFVVFVVPANSALLGATVGGLVRALRPRRPASV